MIGTHLALDKKSKIGVDFRLAMCYTPNMLKGTGGAMQSKER